jgi:hypothetical protein
MRPVAELQRAVFIFLHHQLSTLTHQPITQRADSIPDTVVAVGCVQEKGPDFHPALRTKSFLRDAP